MKQNLDSDPDTKLELELSDAFKKMSQDERDQLGKNSDLLEKLHTNLQDLSDKIDNVEKTIEKTNNKDNTINPKEIEEKLSVILQRLGTITKQPHSGGTKPETNLIQNLKLLNQKVVNQQVIQKR